jgi:superfamily I DNA/RNA helicase
MEGQPPTWHRVAPGDLADAVAAVTGDVRAHHRLTGVVAPAHLHEALRATLAAAGFAAVDHVHELARQEIPLFSPEAVKGLEFDGVVVVEPHAVLAERGAEPITPRGARLLYVAMTRAVQRLDFVTSADPPPVLAGA